VDEFIDPGTAKHQLSLVTLLDQENFCLAPALFYTEAEHRGDGRVVVTNRRDGAVGF
jgi:hypothetical protein